MLVVLDNVLEEIQRRSIVDYFLQSEEVRTMRWQDAQLEDLTNDFSPFAIMIKKASKYFDLSKMVGGEYWANLNKRQDWHVDKDEKLLETTGQIRFPICSIVYYAEINTSGGNFTTETISIKPINNRMLVFDSNIQHRVELYSGNRLSIAVNPWDYKPFSFT